MKLGRSLIVFGIAGSVFSLSTMAQANEAAFLSWNIDKIVERWNKTSQSFAPDFQIEGCELSPADQSYFCILKAPAASLVIETEDKKTTGMWLSFNRDKSISAPSDILRIPALLTKMSRGVDHGDHLSFVKPVILKINKEQGTECLTDEKSNAKFCGSFDDDRQYDYTIGPVDN